MCLKVTSSGQFWAHVSSSQFCVPKAVNILVKPVLCSFFGAPAVCICNTYVSSRVIYQFAHRINVSIMQLFVFLTKFQRLNYF